MAMVSLVWRCAVLMLSFASVLHSTAAASDIPKLPDITNIEVGQEDVSTVWIRWRFKRHVNLTLWDVLFSLRFEALGMKPFELDQRFIEAPCTIRLGSLLPARGYYVRVQATSPNWRDSTTRYFAFLLRDEAAPASPSILSVTLVSRKEVLKYLVTWSEVPTERLSHFEVEVCDWKCTSTKAEATALSAKIVVRFKSNFTVRVAACYDVRVRGPIKNYSGKYEGRSPPAPPERFLKMIDVAYKRDNVIVLGWQDLFSNGGFSIYYDIFVCDPVIAAEFPSRSFEGGLRTHPVYNVYREDPIEDEFEEERRPDYQCDPLWLLQRPDSSKEPGMDQEINSSELTEYFKADIQGGNVRATVKHASQGMIRYHIVFTSGYATYHNPQRTKSIFIGPALSSIYGFTPFTPVNYAFRSCVRYILARGPICGNFKRMTVHTNTAAPSRVAQLSWYFQNATIMVITWERPEVPRGPIDGFRLEIEERLGASTKTYNVSLGPGRLSFTKPFDQKKWYRIGIAAFNKHLERPFKELEGDWIYAHPTYTWRAWAYVNRDKLSILCGSLFATLLFAYAVYRIREAKQPQGP